MKAPARLLALAAFLFAALPARATISYHISLAHREEHIFHVTMVIPNARGGDIVAMPAWNALYQIRDFAYRVTNVRARLEPAHAAEPPKPLAVAKLDKQSWQIGATPSDETSAVTGVEYDVYWDEPGPFSSQLNSHHAFVNLAEILLYLPARRAEDTRVEVDDIPADWRIGVELAAGDQPNTFVAPSYDALVDAPVEIGTFLELRFEHGRTRYRVIVDGSGGDQGRLMDALERIVSYETSLMGGAPMSEYLFILHFGPGSEVGGGGMEHMNSTAIAANSGDAGVSIAAHEFFHLWNVKRIRPRSLEPVDYSREQYTRALWFAEGVTSTYGSYTLVRSGIWSRMQFYDDLAKEIADLQGRPARRWQSVEQSSLDAWLEKYPYYRWPEASISYYNKGKIVGILLDLEIRNATDDHKSLDDVLRGLNKQFAERGRYYDDSDDIRSVAGQVCSCQLEKFFSTYVAGTAEMDYQEFLNSAGLRLQIDTRAFADFGFWPARGSSGGEVVSAVAAGGSAEAAGIQEGDTLLELNGAAFPRNPSRWLADHQPGETVRLRLRRGDTERELALTLGSREERSYHILEDAHAGARQLRIREGLLQGTTE